MPATVNPSLVELRHLNFGYGERPVLHAVSMHIPRGKVTALIGPMSGGKSTTLSLMGGQNRAWSGQMLFDGQDLGPMDQQQLYAVRRRMGMLFQFGALFADMSVFENVAFPLREHTDLSESLIRDIVLMKLNAVGLRNARDLMPSEVSGGMAKRIGIARAIAMDPELVMYDEPFSGLDPISLRVVARLIRQLNDAMGLTSIFASHELTETLGIADHVIILDQGKVAFQGTVAEVRASTDPLVFQYVNERPDGPVRFHYPAVPIEQDFGIADPAALHH
ncbi:ABC transporter ATP-binding protein [Rhodoferax sp.]|jgi:phospholipid/cholesterol/gamma-HCH transport system ATP-binding protein|uniref:ABC transporter ATP-binding protein n=1 Tax=Rhodoferax sp. TaxID=50421 RepID=UPI003BB4C608|nr:ABC transporter ATP-binding protein [Rhodoferax sp.]